VQRLITKGSNSHQGYTKRPNKNRPFVVAPNAERNPNFF